jgi:hypothetical protein
MPTTGHKVANRVPASLDPVRARFSEGVELIKNERRRIWRRAAQALFMYMAAAMWFSLIASTMALTTCDPSYLVSVLSPVLLGHGFAAVYPMRDLSPEAMQFMLAVTIANLGAGVYGVFEIVAITAGMRSPIRWLRLTISISNVACCAIHALTMWSKGGADFWSDIARLHGTFTLMRLLGTFVLRAIEQSPSETSYPPGRLTFALGVLTSCIWLVSHALLATPSYRRWLAGLLARLSNHPRRGSGGSGDVQKRTRFADDLVVGNTAKAL